MAKQKKPPRPRAVTPKGFRDYFGAEVEGRAEMLRTIAGVYHRYGFEALESSAVETVEALGKFLPDVDRPNDGVFAWQEAEVPGGGGGDWLALRYDLTAPLARVYAQHRQELPTPYRRYAMGPVWRNEKPGPGRFRQFYQCDADTVGSGSVAADAEICAMLADTLEAVGIERGDYVVRVNNRKVLEGVLEAMGLGDDDERSAAVMRTIDKFDKVGEAGVRELLGKGRRDASGAFIDGVGLSVEQADTVVSFLKTNSIVDAEIKQGRPERDDRIPGGLGLTHSEPRDGSEHGGRLWNWGVSDHLMRLIGHTEIGLEGLKELAEISELLEVQGYGPDRIVIDPSVVRGLGYYTGPVFEAELTFEITDENGRPRQFGSVAGGGRYDDLVKRFTGQEVPATGVSIGVDRLLAALHARGQMRVDSRGPVIVTVMDRDRMADYQAMAGELRQAGIRAEVYLGNPKSFGNQLKYADKRNAPVAIIVGDDEREKGLVQIKDLVLGAQIAETASVEEWKDRPSQVAVPRDEMVEKVREILTGQDR